MSDGGNNPPGSGRTLGGSEDQNLGQGPSTPGGETRPPAGLRSGASRFATVGSLGGGGGRRDSDDDGTDEVQAESWFAGGERSGISIENPDSRRSVPGGPTVKEILRRAAQAGPPPAGELGLSSTPFRGGGHTLGSDDVESTYIPDPDAEDSEAAIRRLTFWRDGFQVEDGELMRYDDPENSRILAEINAGVAPPSILGVNAGQRVDLRVAKRIHDDYIPPTGTKNFGGAGHRLGGVIPSDTNRSIGSVSMPGSFPSGSSSTPQASSEAARSLFTTKFEVDQSQPTTSIQIRLVDGTRMVARMNLTHTVGDIRNFINASRPENLSRPYIIRLTFPNRTLDDDNATIQGAGLVNSVVIQSLA